MSTEGGERAPWVAARRLNDLVQALTHALESPEETRARLRHGLDLVRQLVPCDCCAVLDAPPGLERRIVTVPVPSVADATSLATTLDELLALVEDHRERASLDGGPASERAWRSWPAHLVVPLIGLDQVIGVLFVGRAAPPYVEGDLCLLAVVAAQISAYLITLRLHREREDFIAMLAHELRTPLTSVLGWASLLRSGAVTEADHARALDAVERNAQTLTRLTEDLLDASRVLTGKLQIEVDRVEAARVVEAAVEAARPAARSRGIELECQIDAAARCLLGDAERLQQVVSNLLVNAVKFTPRGGRIGVRVDHAADHVQIVVRDTGQGISAELLPYVFDRSRQATSSSRRGSDGLGLGLDIARSLVELHGGRVHAESAGPGKGATFTVVLPLAPEGPPG
jgi:signal transduction histidine kinase